MLIKTKSNLTHEFLGYPTLEFSTDMPQTFNERLSSIIVQHSLAFLNQNGFDGRTRPFVGTEGFSGFDRFNIFDWELEEVRVLKKMVLACYNSYLTEFFDQYRKSRPSYITCWPNVIANYDGKVCAHSHHPNPFNISGIYYLAADFSSGLVRTKFWPKVQNQTIEKIYRPVLGSMILFPANLVHCVEPYPSEVYRISLAFDIFFEKKPNVPFSKIHFKENFGSDLTHS